MSKTSWSELSEQAFEREARKAKQPAVQSKTPEHDAQRLKTKKRLDAIKSRMEDELINKQALEVGA